MDTNVVATTPTETPTISPESTSIADHESQFAPNAKRAQHPPPPEPPNEPKPTEPPPPQPAADTAPKPRAAKQQARNEDVPRIQELTRKWREAERRAEDAERRAAAREQTEHQPTSTSATSAFPPRPKVEDFANEAEPWEAYIEATAEWKLGQKLHEAQQVFTQRQQEEQQRAAVAEGEKMRDVLNERMAAFEQHTPDFWQKLDDVDDIKAPDILLHTIGTSDKAPELMYYFATHPDDYVDAIGFAASLELSESSVALLRRRLNRYARVSDAPPNGATGAPIPAPRMTVAPKPPTPVRTGPLKTGDGPPGDDSMSLDEHEKYFGPGAKRRR